MISQGGEKQPLSQIQRLGGKVTCSDNGYERKGGNVAVNPSGKKQLAPKKERSQSALGKLLGLIVWVWLKQCTMRQAGGSSKHQ